MKNLRSFGPFTEQQIESLTEQMNEVRKRTDNRRVHLYAEESLDKFTKHQFKYRTSDVMIVLTVDACTSGRWAYDPTEDWIAFEDPADLTMFMLGYIEPDFKRARLV